MVEHRKLWATDHSYLNDGHEAKLVPKVLATMAEHPNVYGTQATPDKVRQAMLRHLQRGMIFHVASFSKRPDMLTQFRMYCPPRGGFVVGFPRDYLAKISELDQVSYDRHELIGWCQSYFHRYAQKVREVDSSDTTPDELSYKVDSSGPWVFERCRTAIRFKSSEFATEEEVRLLKWHTVGTHYRPSAGGNVVVPYVELDMPNEAIQVQVAPGPGPSQQLAQASIGNLARMCHKHETRWSMSTLAIGEFGFRDL